MGMERVDARLVEAIGLLDARGFSYAEIRRVLSPLAARFAVPRPSYTTVRRIAITERTAVDAKTEAWETVLAKLLTGRVPTPHELASLREAKTYSELVRTLVP
jgi:hypothetical protein